MSPFVPLKAITDANPWQVGETAYLLHQLQQVGQSVPDSWVITAAHYQRSLQKLVAREPIYADWPQLLWQTSSTIGYPVQHLAKRLRRPLLNLPSDFPWDDLLVEIDTPVVRLIPSLWFGENLPTASLVEMLAAPVCWAEPDALEAALKQVWASVLSAKSLAFWSQWPKIWGPHSHPNRIEVAVVVQSVEPATLSGFITLNHNRLEIEVVQGLPEAIAESFPDTYQGHWPHSPDFNWQPGYQERSYTPKSSLDHSLTPCLSSHSLSQTALEVIDASVNQSLWSVIESLGDWSNRPLKVGWYIAETTRTLQTFQAAWWPLKPAPTITAPTDTPPHGVLGYAAAPGQRCGLALVLLPDTPLPQSAHQQIVIADEVAPEWLPFLKTAVGIISVRGGLTCHAAVLARELGLPAVVGVTNATQRFRTGEALRIDGDRGLIEPLPALPEETTAPQPLPQLSAAPRHTEIWLNLSQPELAENFAKLPVAGVGLLRSEWLMLPVLERQHPYQWLANGQTDQLKDRLIEQLRPILANFAPRPVRYRTLDIRSNEFAQLLGAPPVEANPMLGIRGTFSYRHHSDFFQFELEVLRHLQDEGYSNLQLLLPFVRSVQEIADCQKMIQAVGLDHYSDFALWIMAEVPSVLFLLEQYVATGIQGIAIGTHDLTQLLLGIDRDQALFSAHYDETHPAVQAAIAQLIQQAQQLELPCCLCSASPIHHPSFVETMVQAGITSISVDAAALEITAQLIQRVEASRDHRSR